MVTHRLSRREFLGYSAAAAGSVLLGLDRLSAATSQPTRPPNVVVVFVDDEGWGDLSCFGNPTIKTPRLDRMAVEGVKFTEFYVASPACTPSRSALLTGCYPKRIGMHVGVLFPDSDTGLNPEEITIAEILRGRGYATQCIGKWHVGDHPMFLPTRQGFDHYFGIPFSHDMKQAKVPLMRDEKVIEDPVELDTLTQRYTKEAVSFIDSNRDKPFFLYLAHSMPHVPLHVSKEFAGASKRGLYGDVIQELDWSVGQVLDAIQKNGLDQDTLVIYTSDNGPWLPMGANGGSAGPLRDGKGTTWEGGMREPCIMRWPGKLPAGKICDEMACTMDLLPTLAHLAGASEPKDRVIDGKDIFELMTNPDTAKTPRDSFFYYECYGSAPLAAVRSGKWKLHINKADPKTRKVEPMLFDVETDFSETRNVAKNNPDVVERLQKLIDDHRKDIKANSRPAGATWNGAKPIGQWTPEILAAQSPDLQWDVSAIVDGPGTYGAAFLFEKGTNMLEVEWTALLEDGKEVARDTHTGTSGDELKHVFYSMKIDAHKAGAKYTLQAHINAKRAKNSNGQVVLGKNLPKR